jgi:cvfA/B/C family virulence factor
LARYQIMYWKDFPAQVKAQDEAGVARTMLPDRFGQAIDAAAMAEGSADSEAYLDGWSWGPDEERPGSAREVADAVAAELDRAYPQERLMRMIKERG